MAGKARVLGIVLAGGEGKRLLPLTADRAKPAVPFGGTYRLIDFVLSNMVNAGFMKICVLTQYKSHSLDRHISKAWQLSDLIGNYVTPVPAQQRLGPRWYSGSADAIFQSMNLIDDERPDYVVVFGADHVYRMDPSQMLRDHIASGAGVTVAGIRVPRDQADQFGVISTNDGRRISEFLEKPKNPPGLPDSPDEIFASMGNYIFTTKTLQETLALDAADEGSLHDMGGNIIPSLVEANDAAVYDFRENDVPGSTDRDRGYWRDVGTIDAYHDAHMDLVSIEPVFNLYNLRWPMLTSQPQLPGAKFVENPRVHASIVAPGVIISGGEVDHSVLSPQVRVRHGAHVSGSVLMENVDIGAGARVERAILDKNVVVPPGAQIGVDHRVDLARGYTVSAGGITIVGKNQKIDP